MLCYTIIGVILEKEFNESIGSCFPAVGMEVKPVRQLVGVLIVSNQQDLKLIFLVFQVRDLL